MHDFIVTVTYRCVLFHCLLIYNIVTPMTLNISQNTFAQEVKQSSFVFVLFFRFGFCSFFPLQSFPETSIFSC